MQSHKSLTVTPPPVFKQPPPPLRLTSAPFYLPPPTAHYISTPSGHISPLTIKAIVFAIKASKISHMWCEFSQWHKIFTVIRFISVIVFFPSLLLGSIGVGWFCKKRRPKISFILVQISRFVSRLMLLFRICAVPSRLNETGTWIGYFVRPVQSLIEKGFRIRRGLHRSFFW